MSSALAPAAASTLNRWHEMMSAADLSHVVELIADEATFRSPAFWKPYVGSEKVAHVLQTATSIFEDFTYQREFVTRDGLDAVLEFSARIGDLELKGIDMVGFDASGRIERFEVMIRPMRSLQLLAERMRASLDLELLGAS